MKDILIIGAGGLGRETEWLIERINDSKQDKEWNILGYVDDNIPKDELIGNSKVICTVDDLLNINDKIYIAIAIANPLIRKKIYEKLKINTNLEFPNLIDPLTIIGNADLGIGNLISANSILSVNIKVGNFVLLNYNCIIGHDTKIADYVTLYPSVNISGFVKIAENVEIGTGSQIIQDKKICSNVILGAGTVVVRDIMEEGIYVGIPAKKIK